MRKKGKKLCRKKRREGYNTKTREVWNRGTVNLNKYQKKIDLNHLSDNVMFIKEIYTSTIIYNVECKDEFLHAIDYISKSCN